VAAFPDTASILLEVGPGQSLSTLARQRADKPAHQVILTSIRHPHEPASDTAFIANTLGRLWLSGASLNWPAYQAGENLHRLPLPTYPFERKRYWLEPKKPAHLPSDMGGALIKRSDLASWFYVPSWQRSASPLRSWKQLEKGTWLVLSDAVGVGPALIQELEAAGHNVIQVQRGEAFAQIGERAYALKPEAREQWGRLLGTLSSLNALPDRIVHLWTLTPEPSRAFEELQEMQAKGFYSLVALAQAFGESENDRPVQLVVVSNQLHEVTGGETLSAAKATLLGPCMVIPRENPALTCHSVDIVLPDSPVRSNSRLINQVLSEFTGRSPEPVVAYRGAYRWTRTYLPRPLESVNPAQLPLREQGVYLITGGYGGMGLTLAGYLAQAVHARLVLVGRSGLPDRSGWQAWLGDHAEADRISQKIRAIQALEKAGGLFCCLRPMWPTWVKCKQRLNGPGSILALSRALFMPPGYPEPASFNCSPRKVWLAYCLQKSRGLGYWIMYWKGSP
jgi:acyl transferase domain-containing protein